MSGDERTCRFCRAPDATSSRNPDGTWVMRCESCGAQGPQAADPSSAVDAWMRTGHGDDLLRTVIDEAPDVILVTDVEGRLLLGNRALARLHNTTPDDLVSHVEGEVTAVVMRELTDVDSGQLRFFQSIQKPVTGPDGEPCILVIAHDVTDLELAHRAIEERERSYAYAMAAAGEGIWDWDVVSNVVTHNAKWGELFGFEPGELQHPIEVFAGLLHEDDRADVERSLQAALDGAGSYQHEHRMVRRDGTVIHVFDRGRVVERDATGSPTRMAGAVSDISDRINHERRLQVVTEALIDANVGLDRKVQERTAELARANADLQNLALRDVLTGLPNRLAAMHHLASEFARMRRNDARSAVLMMDVDLFKPINDTFGHGVGDDVLKHIAGVITRSLRTGDFVARFGGEEFLALLPDTDLDGARVVAEKIREAVEVDHEPTAGRVTISIGATPATASDADMESAVRRADAALYEAKRTGRNRVIVRPPDSG